MVKSRKHISLRMQLLGWVIILLIALFGVAAILEISARILLPNINVLLTIVSPTEDNRNYVLTPNATTIYRGLYEESNMETIWRINAQGLRADTTIEKKPTDVFRILTYGDSETFGWSVDLDETWQRQMEQIDKNIQVINLGVPGYNIESIANHIEKTLTNLEPDLVIYLFNKNDVYKPLNYHPNLSKSFLYLIANMGIYQLKAQQRKQWRRSQEGKQYFRKHLQRIISTCKQNNAPIILAIQQWKYVTLLPKPYQLELQELTSTVRTINVENIIEDFPRRDAHLTEPAHQALAKYLCNFIAGNVEQYCRPPLIK